MKKTNLPNSTRKRGGLAGKFPEPTEGVDKIVDTFATTLVETFLYFLWYFWTPIALGLALRSLPILRSIPKEIVGICVGGITQILWVQYLSLGPATQLDLILLNIVRAPRRVNHAKIVAEALGVLVGCWCLGVTWKTACLAAQNNLMTLTVLNMPGLPRFNPLQVPSNSSSTFSIKPELESFLAAFLTEFVLSFLHWWGMGLAVIGSKRLEGIQHWRCFVSPALVTLGRSSMGYRPSINSSVALIGAFKDPRSLVGMMILALADISAAVSVVIVPRYFRRRKLILDDTEQKSSDISSIPSSATYVKTCDKPLLPESASTMPSENVQPPSPMVTRRRAKDRNRTPPAVS